MLKINAATTKVIRLAASRPGNITTWLKIVKEEIEKVDRFCYLYRIGTNDGVALVNELASIAESRPDFAIWFGISRSTVIYAI